MKKIIFLMVVIAGFLFIGCEKEKTAPADSSQSVVMLQAELDNLTGIIHSYYNTPATKDLYSLLDRVDDINKELGVAKGEVTYWDVHCPWLHWGLCHTGSKPDMYVTCPTCGRLLIKNYVSTCPEP